MDVVKALLKGANLTSLMIEKGKETREMFAIDKINNNNKIGHWKYAMLEISEKHSKTIVETKVKNKNGNDVIMGSLHRLFLKTKS